MTSQHFVSSAKSVAEFVIGLVALLATLSKIKPVELWLEEKTKKWLTKQPERLFVRRFDNEELERIQLSANEELDMIATILLHELKADRVTILQFDKQADGSYTSTYLGGDLAPGMYSVKLLHRNTPVPADLWLEIQLVHEREGRFLQVYDAKKLDRKVLRAAMLRTGIVSAYYQTLPDAASDCGALLSLSWKVPTALNTEQLAHLHFSARLLAAFLREHWHLKPDAEK